MPYVTKTIRDANGDPFDMVFWDDGSGDLRPAHRVTGDAADPIPVSAVGGGQDLRGANASRPAANSVPSGTTYWSVDRIGQADEFTVSDGSSWVEF